MLRGRPTWRLLCGFAVFAVAVSAHADPEGAHAPNPDNVLTNRPTFLHVMQRMVQPSSAAAATRVAQRRSYRGRHARLAPKKTEAISAVQRAPVNLEQPFWPNPQTISGVSEIAPVVVKTVREMLPPEPEPEAEIVLANELSDLDLAAAPPAPTTDGSAAAHSEEAPREPGRLAQFAQSLAAAPQAAWFEPALLVMAGALASLSAWRLFARG